MRAILTLFILDVRFGPTHTDQTQTLALETSTFSVVHAPCKFIPPFLNFTDGDPKV